MARIRSIKPQFFMNEEVASLPYEWRLLFIGLWTQADRDGRMEDRPQRLKAALFPYDDLDVNDGLSSLVNVGLITRYEGNGQRLICIPKWSKHQQPHIRESVSELPPPDTSPVLASDKPVGFLVLDPDPDQGRSTTGALRARFDEFWAEYPRKVGKDAALKEWLKIRPDEVLTAVLIAKVREHKALPQWVKDGGQFIPHPRTWLHGGRWKDEEQRTASPASQAPITNSERQKAEQARRSWGRCMHQPACSGYGECIATIVYAWREQVPA
jgi:hypothetical protein